MFDGERIAIIAVNTLSGYGAHADQKDLINCVKLIRHKHKHIRIVLGGEGAKVAYQGVLPGCEVAIGDKTSEISAKRSSPSQGNLLAY